MYDKIYDDNKKLNNDYTNLLKAAVADKTLCNETDKIGEIDHVYWPYHLVWNYQYSYLEKTSC